MHNTHRYAFIALPFTEAASAQIGEIIMDIETGDVYTKNLAGTVISKTKANSDALTTFKNLLKSNVGGAEVGVELSGFSAATLNAMLSEMKVYIDSMKSGLSVKDEVKAVATTNVAITGLFAVDGYTLVADNRVLLVGQTNKAQNGIWLAKAGAWVRPTDFDSSADVVSGVFVFVENGTVYGASGWVLSTLGAITIGTTNIDFVRFSGAGQIVAGAGITITGNQIALTVSGVVAGTYRSVTVDTYGRVTAGTNPTTLAGYGISDATPSSHVGSNGASHAIATATLNGFMSAADFQLVRRLESEMDTLSVSAPIDTGLQYSHLMGKGTVDVSDILKKAPLTDASIEVPKLYNLATNTGAAAAWTLVSATMDSDGWITLNETSGSPNLEYAQYNAHELSEANRWYTLVYEMDNSLSPLPSTLMINNNLTGSFITPMPTGLYNNRLVSVQLKTKSDFNTGYLRFHLSDGTASDKSMKIRLLGIYLGKVPQEVFTTQTPAFEGFLTHKGGLGRIISPNIAKIPVRTDILKTTAGEYTIPNNTTYAFDVEDMVRLPIDTTQLYLNSTNCEVYLAYEETASADRRLGTAPHNTKIMTLKQNNIHNWKGAKLFVKNTSGGALNIVHPALSLKDITVGDWDEQTFTTPDLDMYDKFNPISGEIIRRTGTITIDKTTLITTWDSTNPNTNLLNVIIDSSSGLSNMASNIGSEMPVACIEGFAPYEYKGGVYVQLDAVFSIDFTLNKMRIIVPKHWTQLQTENHINGNKMKYMLSEANWTYERTQPEVLYAERGSMLEFLYQDIRVAKFTTGNPTVLTFGDAKIKSILAIEKYDDTSDSFVPLNLAGYTINASGTTIDGTFENNVNYRYRFEYKSPTGVYPSMKYQLALNQAATIYANSQAIKVLDDRMDDVNERVVATLSEIDKAFINLSNPTYWLNQIKAVDGVDSGIDADLLDGYQIYQVDASHGHATVITNFNTIINPGRYELRYAGTLAAAGCSNYPVDLNTDGKGILEIITANRDSSIIQKYTGEVSGRTFERIKTQAGVWGAWTLVHKDYDHTKHKSLTVTNDAKVAKLEIKHDVSTGNIVFNILN